MTFLTFLVSLLVVVVLAVFIAKFWLELFIFWQILRFLFYNTLISFVSAILWMVFIANTSQGFKWYFSFFFLTYTIALAVLVVIFTDIINMSISFIRNIFKIK